jgi:alkanesulfonate monooxygenase SsuD/methylene tetrahydromethanopterin reductase-like flavin-dependent oxidoreductase (luciferase family)
MAASRGVRVGLTLPSFVDDIEIVFGVARAAEAAGVDAVFAYEHLFRVGRDGQRRPALDCWVTLGAVAAVTERLVVGSLVARTTLRAPAVLRLAFDTVHRVSGGRLIAVVGTGDHESRAENEEFGIAFGTVSDRVQSLHAALDALAGAPYPVWVGGRHPRVLAAAARAGGWNRWGGAVEEFAADVAVIRTANPAATVTWGGLVVLAEDDSLAREKAARLGARAGTIVGGPRSVAAALRPYVDAGATWLVLGPVDSSDPANAARVAAVRAALEG